MTSCLLRADAVSRRFGNRLAVDDVSFELSGGECLALFGPNGAGKTTLLRLLGGLLKPYSGAITLAGSALGDNTRMRARIGLISHRTMLYPALTALENVEFAARLYEQPDARASALGALRRMGIERPDTAVRLLSRGMQQRVSIARAIVNEPVLLLADEPYSGLDESGAQALTQALLELKADGAALVVVTHQLNEGLALADHAAVMRQGAFVSYQRNGEVNRSAYAAHYRDLVAGNV